MCWLAPEILVGDAVNSCPLKNLELVPHDPGTQEDVAASRRIRDSNLHLLARDIVTAAGKAQPAARHVASFNEILAEASCAYAGRNMHLAPGFTAPVGAFGRE